MIVRADEIHKRSKRFLVLKRDALYINRELRAGRRKILRSRILSKGGLADSSAFYKLVERCRAAGWTVDVDLGYNLLFSSYHDRAGRKRK